MKKILTIAGVLLANVVMGQIATLQHTYSTGVIAENTDDGYKYWKNEKTTNKITIYNADHSLYKEVNTGVIGTFITSGLIYPYKELFNNDNKLEFMFSTINNGIRTAYIMNEDGQTLQTINNVQSYEVRNIAGQATLIVNTLDASLNSATEIYHLQGKFTGIKPETLLTDKSIIYPNPFETTATITYLLPKNQSQAPLNIFDVSGKLVKQLIVTNQFNEVLIQRGDLPSGNYIYELAGSKNTFTIH